MRFSSRVLAVFCFVLGCAGSACKSRPSGERHEFKDVQLATARADQRNTIILVGIGSYWTDQSWKSDLPGAEPDLIYLENLYSKTLDWRVISLFNPSLEEVLQVSADVAKALAPGKVLHWHFEGHGESGHMIFGNDKQLNYQQVAEAIACARVGMPPIERMIVTVDACFSGATSAHGQPQGSRPTRFAPDAGQDRAFQAVWQVHGKDFKGAMEANRLHTRLALSSEFVSAADQTEVLGDAVQKGFARESVCRSPETGEPIRAQAPDSLIVMASARASEEAADWEYYGGPFGIAWIASLQTLATEHRSTARVRDLLETVRLTTYRLTATAQEPVLWVTPATLGDSMLEDLMR